MAFSNLMSKDRQHITLHIIIIVVPKPYLQRFAVDTSLNLKCSCHVWNCFPIIPTSLDPNDQKSLEGMQKMEKEESPTDATVELDGDDMEGSGEDGDLEGSDSEAAQWADQEQWFGMQ